MKIFISTFQFNLTPIENGAIFIVNGGMYAISAPIWGWICDHVSKHLKLITIFGCILISIGFGLIGPFPYIPLET
jgi:MFS family permease